MKEGSTLFLFIYIAIHVPPWFTYSKHTRKIRKYKKEREE